MDANKEKKSDSDIQQGEFIQGKFRPIPEGHPASEKKEDEGQSIDIKAIRRILREEARSTQQTERFLQRGMGRGTRGLNRAVGNFGRLGGRGAAALGRVGSLAGQLGARAAAAAAPAVVGFFASPPGWIVLGVIALIAVITFLIVRLTGQNVDATQINFQEINTSSMQLSLTPTETPPAALSSAPTPPEKP